jgi:hypothetical protein
MTMGNKRIAIRKDVKNKNKWVFEVYYVDEVNGTTVWRTYPNVISSRYLTKNDAQEAAERFLNTGKLDWNDQTKRTPYDWNEKRELRKVRA